jgi:hypothetical protein
MEARLEKSGVAAPLVMGRPHLLAKRGITGLRRSGHATLLLDQAGWASAGAMP